jgi:hypothetical protein
MPFLNMKKNTFSMKAYSTILTFDFNNSCAQAAATRTALPDKNSRAGTAGPEPLGQNLLAGNSGPEPLEQSHQSSIKNV